ncbi:MAG: protein kinase, partial [Acidobacteria bacterium]|nr:protein kinase [Acidobacteriota bacterium]
MLSQTISHYKILDYLGGNLIGEVYIAEDARLGRKVALQILSDKFTRDGERMNRLAHESRALSALNHPNIRMIYEVGSGAADGALHHFIASEYVDGQNLRNHLDRRRLKIKEILDALLQTATGLAAAHAAGVLHRDLQPENIVLRADGYVKIIDFGLAKLLEQDSMMIELGSTPAPLPASPPEPFTERPAPLPTPPPALLNETELLEELEELEEEDGEDGGDDEGEEEKEDGDEIEVDPYRTRRLDDSFMAGLEIGFSSAGGTAEIWWAPRTSGYLSPEQIRGEMVDERSDIFSLGVVAFEMCAGRLPFEGQTANGMLNSILQSPPPPLNKFRPDAPDELEWIIAKALSKDRDERYQTAREMISDLKSLIQRLDFEAEQERLERRDPTGQLQRPRGSDKLRVPQTSPISPGDSSQRTGATSSQSTGHSSSRGSGRLRSRSGSSRAFSGPIDSVAILPLTNASDDPAAEYLSDGITESIINSLSRLPGLRVMARATVFRYKGRDVDPLEIGGELNVRAVFVGRLLQRGENLVIKAELVDVMDGSLLWAEQYHRKSGDILELEDEIARQISEHLKVKLSSEQRQGLAKHYTDNAEAYELYLRGRYFWNQRSLPGMKKGIEYFVQSIRRDARYALAYAGMADCYLMLSVYQLPPREFVPKARMQITRALEYDDQLAEAHASFGSLSFWYDWDFVKAELEFQRAIELNPNLPEPYQWLAYLYAAQNRFDAAFENLRHAQGLDPLSIVITANTAEILYRARRFDDAVAQCEKALEMDPQFAKAIYWRVMAWIANDRLTEAATFLEAALSGPSDIDDVQAIASAMLAVIYARGGALDQARLIFDSLRQYAVNNYFPPYYFAVIAANLGDSDQAFAWLDKAYQERSGWMPWLKHEPLLDSLHQDARFNDLL